MGRFFWKEPVLKARHERAFSSKMIRSKEETGPCHGRVPGRERVPGRFTIWILVIIHHHHSLHWHRFVQKKRLVPYSEKRSFSTEKHDSEALLKATSR